MDYYEMTLINLVLPIIRNLYPNGQTQKNVIRAAPSERFGGIPAQSKIDVVYISPEAIAEAEAWYIIGFYMD